MGDHSIPMGGESHYDPDSGLLYGYSVAAVAFAPNLWQWSAYGPMGSEVGQAESEQAAHSVAANAMRQLRGWPKRESED